MRVSVAPATGTFISTTITITTKTTTTTNDSPPVITNTVTTRTEPNPENKTNTNMTDSWAAAAPIPSDYEDPSHPSEWMTQPDTMTTTSLSNSMSNISIVTAVPYAPTILGHHNSDRPTQLNESQQSIPLIQMSSPIHKTATNLWGTSMII